MFVGILTSCFSESALLYLLTVVFGTATTAAILVLPVIKNTGRKKENGISNTISQTINSLTDANTTSAPQEMANAAYRMVDMLTILAYIEGVDSSLISNVNDTLSQNNKNLSGAPQQTANGLYRAAELLYLISQKAYSSKVSDLIYDLLDEMYTANESCSSAVQQTTNGMSTIYYMVMVLAMAKA